MLESVLFPAPFSPSSACTSPAAASKSTWSFASTPGKCFVIPRMVTAAPRGAAVTDAGVGCSSSALALRAADDSPDEPVHRVEVLDGQLLALGHAELAALVIERAGELVELAADQRGLLRCDR